MSRRNGIGGLKLTHSNIVRLSGWYSSCAASFCLDRYVASSFGREQATE